MLETGKKRNAREALSMWLFSLCALYNLLQSKRIVESLWVSDLSESSSYEPNSKTSRRESSRADYESSRSNYWLSNTQKLTNTIHLQIHFINQRVLVGVWFLGLTRHENICCKVHTVLHYLCLSQLDLYTKKQINDRKFSN